MYCLRVFMKKYRNVQKEFLDLEKEYDNVPRKCYYRKSTLAEKYVRLELVICVNTQ